MGGSMQVKGTGAGACAIWITGLPGSGKTTIAEKVAGSLGAKHLQLDRVRKVVTPNPDYSDKERGIVYASLAYMAYLLVDSGVSVVIDATANRREYRDLARNLIPRFIEVYVECPIEMCMKREQVRDAGYAPVSIYAGAGKGGTVPGVDVEYEAPLHPEVVVRSDRMGADGCADQIARYVGERKSAAIDRPGCR
ncbi:MAG: putative adenylyl-sulfate kinase [Candidatus Methanogaster sp.]|nr:MAG: putative adenylyl-sulfate kinase [ANME-2 cluster archaeon]